MTRAIVPCLVFTLAVVASACGNEDPTATPVSPTETPAATPPATPRQTGTPATSGTPTPDLDRAGWYVPYLQSDGDLPQFEGEIAGIAIPLSTSTPERICDGPTSRAWDTPAEEAFGASPVGIPLESLPASLEFFSGPEYTICESTTVIDSKAVLKVVEAPPNAAEAAGTLLGEGSITVNRWIGPGYSGFTAAAERWSEGNVAGHPAAILEPVIESVGTSAIVIHDAEAGVTTLAWGQGVYLESLELVMEWLLDQ